MSRRLPSQLFVTIKNEGTQDEFIEASEAYGHLPDFGESCKVGIYRLEKTVEAENKTELISKT